MNESDIPRLFQAFVAPAIFVSATALLALSVNVRLMGIVSRLRQFVHAKHDATRQQRQQEADAYTSQIASIERRAELIRRCFLLVLVALAGSLISCLLLGAGLYWKDAAFAAVIVFVASMLALLIGALYYIAEVRIALSSVQDEAKDVRFMDLGEVHNPGGEHPPHP
jgi:drug/metabolite transporter (DMT)-like permease